ncbi:RnfABCDGE type electron transport complex subunit G [Desulfohalovibrio reitneri]|uniref:RnfABCDGE type electron transport complex subunit G n=1 Tax=Desulfohalovibrio reitneri TaxID=1307759 RepID=UPI0004A6AE6C|nr:RnfABCDGE type electron transport complex subunit G [Desulfohalovibrio reitneri]
MREGLRMIIVLTCICAGSGFLLASVKQWTEPKIENQILTHVKGPAVMAVLPPHDNDPIMDRRSFVMPDGGEAVVFPAVSGGELRAVALERTAEGYGGPLGVMVGFEVGEEALTGIAVTTHRETPGVGSRVTLPGFTRQFGGHPFSQLILRSGGGDIDAVSGATVSSKAAISAVNKAVEDYRAIAPSLREAFGS